MNQCSPLSSAVAAVAASDITIAATCTSRTSCSRVVKSGRAALLLISIFLVEIVFCNFGSLLGAEDINFFKIFRGFLSTYH